MHMDRSQGYVSEFTREFTIKMPQSRWSTLTAADIVRACAIDMHVDISEGSVCARFTIKMPQTMTGATVLREPVQSKCTWTSQEGPLMREFTLKMKMPKAKTGTSVLCEPAQSKCTWALQRNCFCENAPDQDRDNRFVGHDLPPAFTPTVRTPSVDTLFGDISETMSWHAFFDQSCKQPKQCWRCMNMIGSNDTIRIPKVSMSARYHSICHAQKTPWNTILT